MQIVFPLPVAVIPKGVIETEQRMAALLCGARMVVIDQGELCSFYVMDPAMRDLLRPQYPELAEQDSKLIACIQLDRGKDQFMKELDFKVLSVVFTKQELDKIWLV